MAKVKKKPMRVADPNTRVYIPDLGVVTVEQLQNQLRKKIAKGIEEDITKKVVTKILESGGIVGRRQLINMINEAKKEFNIKRSGVTLTKLIESGLIARIKVEGLRPFYSVTEEAIKSLKLKKDWTSS